MPKCAKTSCSILRFIVLGPLQTRGFFVVKRGYTIGSLSMKDQDDLIRAVFGLTRDDLLPDVNGSDLRTY